MSLNAYTVSELEEEIAARDKQELLKKEAIKEEQSGPLSKIITNKLVKEYVRACIPEEISVRVKLPDAIYDLEVSVLGDGEDLTIVGSTIIPKKTCKGADRALINMILEYDLLDDVGHDLYCAPSIRKYVEATLAPFHKRLSDFVMQISDLAEKHNVDEDAIWDRLCFGT